MALFQPRKQGGEFEQQARRFLEQKGLVFIAANQVFKCGELDLIMRDQQTIVFVEVRQRKSDKFGSAVESVSWRKQQKWINAANLWLSQFAESLDTVDCRFDVIAYDGTQHQLTWLKNFIEFNG
ncbi:YraN family protein [Gallibacterium sp. AGMB14963]|uniref:YraN family protein n=1 Tax=Gallibacterium faecale TaxID=3019086 RepID=UPI0022F1A64D|nr:YraN family protein [Gallibacterium sp. AGMB14963]MDA3977408.1 YraN family protein [Gallibacterium sp. AGMB14963]